MKAPERYITPVGWSAEAPDAPAPAARQKLAWIVFAALGSMLVLAVSNHLTQNISSIPLLWVVPLALYLTTFILCFENKDEAHPWYQRTFYLPMLGAFLCGMVWLIADKSFHFELYWQIGVFCAGLFIACMFCHGELADRKPAPEHLTTFYLMVAIGVALGSLLVGIAAPLLLPTYFELEAWQYLPRRGIAVGDEFLVPPNGQKRRRLDVHVHRQ